METTTQQKGMVLRIERSSVHDGDGFRTVVFLKGCPLRCQWCSTPESQSFPVEKFAGNTYGFEATVEDVMKEVRKDSLFFFHSGGGMTLSGGELLAQPAFATALLKAAWTELIDTTVETTFFAPWQVVEGLLPYVNTAFVDLKFATEALHQTYCGASNRQVMDNLRHTNTAAGDFKLVVRVPIIPGVNDDPTELAAMAQFCASLTRLHHVQLLPYHRLGMETYTKMGLPYLMREVKSPREEHMQACRAIFAEYLPNVQ